MLKVMNAWEGTTERFVDNALLNLVVQSADSECGGEIVATMGEEWDDETGEMKGSVKVGW
jgi:hypothetical protein